MIDRFERFSLAISEISRYWHKITADEMQKYGLKGSHSVYLVTLNKYPEGLTAPQLCRICGRDKADASRAMAIMEQKKLVYKEGVNRRIYGGAFKLTDEGKAAAKYVCERASLAVKLAGDELGEEKRAVFYQSLEHITEKLKMLSEDGIPE